MTLREQLRPDPSTKTGSIENEIEVGACRVEEDLVACTSIEVEISISGEIVKLFVGEVDYINSEERK